MESPLQSLYRLRRLLTLEYEEEKNAFTLIADKMGIDRLMEKGQAWSGVKIGRDYYNSLDQRVVEITREVEEEVALEKVFQPGKPVLFITKDKNEGAHYPFGGTVVYSEPGRMTVSVGNGIDLGKLRQSEWCGLALAFDETSYRAMFEAIDRTVSAKGRLGELRDLIYSNQKARRLTFAPLEIPFLNPDQQSGVNKVLQAKDVAIVHGPPGTGKTTTLVEAIYETLRREPQVMVCAQSNMAVDWICERLVERGVTVLRLGNPTRVTDAMLAMTYERRYADHPDYPSLWAVRRTIRQLRSSRHRNNGFHQKLESLKSRATELESRINADILGDAKVIASTLVGSNHRLLSGRKFSTLFIDEAAQALEAACLIPLRRAGRLILAGDHCQLPPTVKSYEAMRQGLGRSLMERIVENHPEAVTLLTTQYRMHKEIMKFSSDWFYHGLMKADPLVESRGILGYDIPMEWIDTAAYPEAANPEEESSPVENPASAYTAGTHYRESSYGLSHGRINVDEGILTLRVLQQYLNKVGRQRVSDEHIDIGLISPYRAQVNFLRKLLKGTPWFKPLRRNITVDTVDGFQGQERDIMIISMVRSNDSGNIGFLADLRRMNVAITRARMKVIVVGHKPTMSRHPFYRKLISYIEGLKTSEVL